VPGGLFDRLAHVVFAVEVEDVGDQVQRVLVVVDFRVETCKVEAVGYVFFVDFAEVFIATRGDELRRFDVSLAQWQGRKLKMNMA
jgi:hypothetical protein